MGLGQGAVSVGGDGLVVDVVSERTSLVLESGQRDDNVDTLSISAGRELDGSDDLVGLELGDVAGPCQLGGLLRRMAGESHLLPTGLS